jgi:hypothetical protein
MVTTVLEPDAATDAQDSSGNATAGSTQASPLS